ncbi:PepSY domain-containing protein [Prosthecomicrobium sp. N25]|uniref:PepSY domain-containing protein n=1 Tax=Prosthecomicrobium sp. N25 TaxID=3129254 RepID=UPI003076F5D5
MHNPRPIPPAFPTGALLALLIGVAGPAAAAAERHADHETARRAVERGEAKPLAEILPAVAAQAGGEIVGVEFEREDGRWVYEIRVLDPVGRRREIYVDARDGRILKRKGE